MEINMTNHKPHSNLPWLAGAVVACALLAAPAARAQTTTQLTATPTSTAGGSTLVKSAPSQQVGVIGGLQALPSTSAPEAITSSGAASITDTVSLDAAGGLPVDEVIVNLGNCVLKGAKSLAVYSTTGFARITRQLLASDSYTGTLPIWTTNAAGVTSYYTITYTVNTTHNTTTNVLTSVTLALGDYVPPASAGGVAAGGTIQ